jgi:uncharacterized Fe-S cluster protein YjdI
MVSLANNIAGVDVLTHSSESCFKVCPRKFQLRYRLGLRPAHDSDALRLGSAFHAGLEVLKGGATVAEAEQLIRGSYADATCPPWLQPDEFAVEEETAVALVRGYAKRYENDLIVEYVAVEQSFEIPIVNPDTGRQSKLFKSAGKIDGIVRLPDGRLALLEHKTTSDSIEPGSDYWRRLLMDSQISRYFLAAREVGFDVQTVVYDVVRKPQIRPKAVAKADRLYAVQQRGYFSLSLTGPCPERETPKMFGARLLHDLSERPEHYFARSEIPRLESDLNEYRGEQWQIAQQIHQADRHGRFYRNTNACLSPYRCEYLDVCRGMCGDPNEQTPVGFKRADNLHPELAVNGAEA